MIHLRSRTTSAECSGRVYFKRLRRDPASGYSKGSSDRNRSLGASQPISNGLLMLIRGNHIVISVLLSEIELESSAGFL